MVATIAPEWLAIAGVGNGVGAASPLALWLGFILVLVVIGTIVVPAIWSLRDERRKAALAVLDCIVRALQAKR